MNLKKYWAMLPLAFAGAVNAETEISTAGSTFEFSTEVSRTVEKDVMRARIYSQKTGKSLPELKKVVSANLNKVIEQAKQFSDIEVESDGVRNQLHYTSNNKIDGWVAEGFVHLKSKNIEAMSKVLENLGENVAVDSIDFSVSLEKLAALEDEMTLEIIQKFQHKAEVIKKGINAKSYTLTDVRLDTPNGDQGGAYYGARPMAMMTKMANVNESMPLEAGKETISATASGKVKFE